VEARELLYSGKAKSVYKSGVPGELIIQFRDDITAFDGGKKDMKDMKGSYNARVSAFFFRYLEEHGVRTHFIRMLDDRTMIARKLVMIPLEVIVRNLAAGSLARNYPFKEGQPFNPPVIIIDYKDDTRHDPMLNDDLILALKILTREELAEVKQISLRVNAVLREYLARQGITLVDFKLEFGKADSIIYLGDEISMDSMRLWDANTGESLDKDVYRFDKGDVLAAYNKVSQRIIADQKGTSGSFSP
jgi:phosphoribosylaminoimidazole-succinocarboxamide synthase